MVRRSLATLATAALLVTSGCGSGASPADDVPALSAALDRVDEAIADQDHDAARDAVAALTDLVTEAEETGDLDAEQADRILSAAESLVAALPRAEPAAPEPEAPTSSAPADEEAEPALPEKPGKNNGKGKKSKGKKKH